MPEYDDLRSVEDAKFSVRHKYHHVFCMPTRIDEHETDDSYVILARDQIDTPYHILSLAQNPNLAWQLADRSLRQRSST